ncbi:MAG: hypothetical protein GKR86_00990 [Ilumatobacter sp.]|nr:hypothetical protein [Ilumatobacter sp.]
MDDPHDQWTDLRNLNRRETMIKKEELARKQEDHEHGLSSDEEVKIDWDTNKIFKVFIFVAIVGWALLLATTIRLFTQ